MVEFVSYTGKYPCLCSGELSLMIDGEKKIFKDCLVSNGCIDVDNGEREEAPWSIDKDSIPTEYHHLLKEIEEVVNENVDWGCCGGCI